MLWPCIKTWWAQKKTEKARETAQGGPVRLNQKPGVIARKNSIALDNAVNYSIKGDTGQISCLVEYMRVYFI